MRALRKKTRSRNTWGAKLRRFSTCLMPVSKERAGSCARCGACCKLPVRCPFLKYDEMNLSYCGVYRLRPPNCRKYPRTRRELITETTCGYRFD